jgi:ketosteroid isomerase-like protein
MRLRTAVVAAGFALLVSSLEAQSIDPALTAAIAARDKAAIARDADGVAKYTAEDYTAVNPNGVLNTKEQRIRGLRQPPTNPNAPPQEAQRTEMVRMYGPNAAVARMKVSTSRQLFVWVKNAQGWQAATVHIVPDAMPAVPATPQKRSSQPQSSTLVTPAGLTGERAAVFAAQKHMQDAFFSGDRAAYEKLRAGEHVRLVPGMIRFADEVSANIDAPLIQPKSTNITVQVRSQLGIVRWLETGGARQQTTWLTRVFAKKASGWQSVATASSGAGDPPIAP